MSSDSIVEGDYRNGLSYQSRLGILLNFWDELNLSGDTGATTRVVLDEIEREVTERLEAGDLLKAESLTCQAALLIVGCDNV